MTVEAGYFLPFDQTKHPVRISQGNNGPWSHKLLRFESRVRPGAYREQDLTYSVDFDLPLGTPVMASRAGRVVFVWHQSQRFYGGLDPEVGNNLPPNSTNLVQILHEDHTRAVYAHLSRTKRVDLGQEIKPGELIGYTGRSGWIAQIPHLHFYVARRVGASFQSLPITFKDYSGTLDHRTLVQEGKLWLG